MLRPGLFNTSIILQRLVKHVYCQYSFMNSYGYLYIDVSTLQAIIGWRHADQFSWIRSTQRRLRVSACVATWSSTSGSVSGTLWLVAIADQNKKQCLPNFLGKYFWPDVDAMNEKIKRTLVGDVTTSTSNPPNEIDGFLLANQPVDVPDLAVRPMWHNIHLWTYPAFLYCARMTTNCIRCWDAKPWLDCLVSTQCVMCGCPKTRVSQNAFFHHLAERCHHQNRACVAILHHMADPDPILHYKE